MRNHAAIKLRENLRKALKFCGFSPTTPQTFGFTDAFKNPTKILKFRLEINALRGTGGQCAGAGTWRSLSGFRTR